MTTQSEAAKMLISFLEYLDENDKRVWVTHKHLVNQFLTSQESSQWLKNPLTFEQAKANNEMLNGKFCKCKHPLRVAGDTMLESYCGKCYKEMK